MDLKAELIKRFYAGLPKDRIKLETFSHGFDFLEKMTADGMTLDYGELVLCKEVHKYKFSNVAKHKMDELLFSHVHKNCNVCLYFNENANSLFAFNLDKDQKFDDVSDIPELTVAANLVRSILLDLGCEPLVVASGKGYHIWCRLAAPESNDDLYRFMLRTMAKALHQLHVRGLDHHRIYTRFYPDPRTVNKISLRLFGSCHLSNKLFSWILADDGLLDEDASWIAFEEHLERKTIDKGAFQAAYRSITGSL